MFQRDNEGFSLVEVVIAMLLLAALSLAVLPLIIGATERSVENRALLAATALAKDELSRIQADFPPTPGSVKSCDDLQTWPKRDQMNGLAVEVTATEPCPSAYPASVAVTVTVTEDGTELISVATRVRVGAE